MNVFIIIFTFLLAFFLFFYFKKGTFLYEIFHLPEYWLHVLPVSTRRMQQQKIAYGEHARQYFWLLKPLTDQPRSNKIIVWLHGGGWQHGRAEMFKANGQVLVNGGHTVLVASYRLAPKFNYYAMREDLNLLTEKTLQTVENEQIENSKIIIGGMSAGANLAALLLYDRATLATLGYQQNIFAGGLFFGAPLDLNGMSDNYVLRAYAGRKNSTQFNAANPVNYLTDNEHLPILIVQGTKDGLVNHQQVRSFLRQLKRVQSAAVEVLWLENGSHLDAVRWTYRDDDVRKRLLTWLENIS